MLWNWANLRFNFWIKSKNIAIKTRYRQQLQILMNLTCSKWGACKCLVTISDSDTTFSLLQAETIWTISSHYEAICMSGTSVSSAEIVQNNSKKDARKCYEILSKKKIRCWRDYVCRQRQTCVHKCLNWILITSKESFKF